MSAIFSLDLRGVGIIVELHPAPVRLALSGVAAGHLAQSCAHPLKIRQG